MSNPYAPPEPGSTPPQRPADGPRRDEPGGGGQGGGGQGDRGGPGHRDLGRPWPPVPAPAPEDRRPPGPEELARHGRVARQVRLATLTFLAGMLASLAPLPWPAVGTVLAVVAVVLAARAAHAGRATGSATRSPFATSAVVLVVVASLWTVASSSTLLLWPARQALQDCQETALTVTAQARCAQAYSDRLEQMGLDGAPVP